MSGIDQSASKQPNQTHNQAIAATFVEIGSKLSHHAVKYAFKRLQVLMG